MKSWKLRNKTNNILKKYNSKIHGEKNIQISKRENEVSQFP